MLNPIQTLREGLANLPAKDQDFARSLLSQFETRGSLSDKQWPWVHKLAERAKPKAPTVDGIRLPNISALMQKAATKLKRARITMRGFSVRTSRYADVFYICSSDQQYLGKIMPDACFIPSHEARQALERISAELLALDADPVKAATVHGHETGECCFCARELTDARSVTVGYGPICAARFGLPWGEKQESVNTFETIAQ